MTDLKKQLLSILGKDNLIDDEKYLYSYARDQSFVPGRKPDMVVFPESREQVQEVVRLANNTKMPLIPFSSGKNLHGATIPDQGGMILNMSRMKKIIEIDEENWFAIVEPGVTYQQLQDVLADRGFRVMTPFSVPPERSVLTSYLERDPVLSAPSFEYGNALIMDTEIVLPTGELFHTGNWSTGGQPGSPNGPIRNIIYRLWTGAQGTLGILTKMGLQIDKLSTLHKIFFIAFTDLAHAIETVRAIQRKEIGIECFLLNNFNLAALLTKDWKVPVNFPASPLPSNEFDTLKSKLPPWVLTICLRGLPRHPEEKIACEQEALFQTCSELNTNVLENIPNAPGTQKIFSDELLRPWGILKKFNYRGAVHDVMFKCPLHKVVLMEQTIRKLAREYGYPFEDIGGFLLPIERGRAIHCEFDLHCDSADEEASQAVKTFWMAASQQLLDRGAYFDRPYGAWADMVYNRSASYTIMLRQLKKELDPNNILNPGKLCFSC